MSRSIEQLVNQQVLRWEKQRNAERTAASPVSETPGPVITISRQFGALGGDVGRGAAHNLGYSFYSQELVHEIAERAHVRQQVVASLDERVRSGISQWVSDKMAGGGFQPSDYLRNLSEVVLTLGRHGKSVIVGRGAHLILDPALVLRVRCYAPLEWRVEQVAAREQLGLAAARERVLQVDAERSAFFRQHFSTEIGDPIHFDLLLNTATYSLAACAELVCHTYYTRFGELALKTALPSRIRSTRPEADEQSDLRAASR